MVDLSEKLLDYEGGRTGAENMVNQLLLTLGRLEDVERCRFWWRASRWSCPKRSTSLCPWNRLRSIIFTSAFCLQRNPLKAPYRESPL